MLAFENTNAVARFAAAQAIVFGEDIDPDRAIDALDAVTFDDVAAIAGAVDPDDRRGRVRRAARRAARLLDVTEAARHARSGARARVLSRLLDRGVAEMLNERELARYVQRVDGRWPLQRVLLGGARVAGRQGRAARSASAAASTS